MKRTLESVRDSFRTPYSLRVLYSKDGSWYEHLPLAEYYAKKKDAINAFNECYNAHLLDIGDASWQNKLIEDVTERMSSGVMEMYFVVKVSAPGDLQGYYMYVVNTEE